jgi:hypothetical protein
MVIRLLICTLFLCLPATTFAQSWELGVNGGSAAYQGDLNTYQPFKFTDLAIGGYVKRNFNGYFSARLNYANAKIRANDQESSNQQFYNRNLSFFSPLDEVSLLGEFNFFNYVPEIGRNRFTPYIFIGAGVVSSNPQTYYQGELYQLNLYQTEGQEEPYKRSALVVPLGTGVKYNIAGKWSLGAELGMRIVHTDYLDDVSNNYPDKSLLPNDISRALSDRSGEVNGIYLGAAGSQRGDFRKNDGYIFLGITLSYTFITRNCPSF